MAMKRTEICLYESIRRPHASLGTIDRGSSLSAEDDGTKHIIIYTKKVYNRGWKVRTTWSSLEVLGREKRGGLVGWVQNYPDPIARWNYMQPENFVSDSEYYYLQSNRTDGKRAQR